MLAVSGVDRAYAARGRALSLLPLLAIIINNNMKKVAHPQKQKRGRADVCRGTTFSAPILLRQSCLLSGS